VKGETDYQLGVTETMQFITEYQVLRRNVQEQVLNLQQSEKQTLFDILMENYQPENRLYRYNFIFDNCTTRPRDIIAKAIRGKLQFSPELQQQHETFQQLIDHYTDDSPAISFGIHLVLGANKNKEASLQQTFFLPERLMNAYATAHIQRDSVTVPLVLFTRQLVAIPDRVQRATFDYIMAIMLAVLLTAAAFSYFNNRKRRISLWFDAILFGITGITGCIVFYLTFFSLHPLVSHNWNVVWMNPLLLIFAIIVPFKALRNAAYCLQFFFLACELFILIGSFFLVQPFTLDELLLVAALAIRSLLYVKLARRKSISHFFSRRINE
jgi:heme/copper-type cytochrome/quinol oxidase subunit 4